MMGHIGTTENIVNREIFLMTEAKMFRQSIVWDDFLKMESPGGEVSVYNPCRQATELYKTTNSKFQANACTVKRKSPFCLMLLSRSTNSESISIGSIYTASISLFITIQSIASTHWGVFVDFADISNLTWATFRTQIHQQKCFALRLD